MVHDAGVGRHLIAVALKDPNAIIAWEKSIFALEWLYLTAVAFSKASILSTYLRLFQANAIFLRRLTWIMLVVLVLNFIAFAIASNLQCIPFAYMWDKSIPGGKCFDVDAFFKASSAPNIATDVVILGLPIPLVWGLKASFVRKVGLMAVFAAGSMYVDSHFFLSSFFVLFFLLEDAQQKVQ